MSRQLNLTFKVLKYTQLRTVALSSHHHNYRNQSSLISHADFDSEKSLAKQESLEDWLAMRRIIGAKYVDTFMFATHQLCHESMGFGRLVDVRRLNLLALCGKSGETTLKISGLLVRAVSKPKKKQPQNLVDRWRDFVDVSVGGMLATITSHSLGSSNLFRHPTIDALEYFTNLVDANSFWHLQDVDEVEMVPKSGIYGFTISAARLDLALIDH